MMFRRIYAPALFAVLLWPPPAEAQPLFHCEHDWTVMAGERRYGLKEIVQTPGEFRRTQVWVGHRSFDIHLRAAAVAGLAMALPAAVILALCIAAARVSRRGSAG
ncbi:MAG: hypothetical protein KY475_25120 [Planctomycetes bacterium]|nr:hypothetical protein [Planctomycetota bacterium]